MLKKNRGKREELVELERVGRTGEGKGEVKRGLGKGRQSVGQTNGNGSQKEKEWKKRKGKFKIGEIKGMKEKYE